MFPHRAFPHRAFQHCTMQKVYPRYTLTLIQPKIYYAKRTRRPSQPVGQINVRRGIPHRGPRVFAHRAFPHRAFQHRTIQKVYPRHTLTLIQPKIYYSRLATAEVRRTRRPSQPVLRGIRLVIHHTTPPYHLNGWPFFYSRFSRLLTGVQPNSAETSDSATLASENSMVRKLTVWKRG